MTSRNILLAVVAVFTLVNSAIVFGANEPYKTFYSAFGIEDPDPDLDKVYSNEDTCPGTPFDFVVVNKSTKKQKVTLSFTDSADPTKNIYFKVKNIAEDGKVTLQTATTENFSGSTTAVVEPNKIVPLDAIGKRVRVLYANADKGVTVLWVSEKESTRKGCTVSEYASARAAGDEITPP